MSELSHKSETPLMSAIEQSQTPKLVRRASLFILLFIILSIPVLAFMPWTQTVFGQGSVIAFNPVHRPQAVISPIKGRIMKWYVVEGDKVKAGQRLVDLVDNDPRRLDRLKEQALLAEQRLALAASVVFEQEARLKNVEAERPLLLAQADARRDAAEAEVIRATQSLQRDKANLFREEQNFLRLKRLHNDPAFEPGAIVSTNSLEEAKRSFILAKESIPLAEAGITVATQKLEAAEADLKAVDTRTLAKIAETRQLLVASISEQKSIEQQNQMIQSEVERQENQWVRAPVGGTIYRVLANSNANGQLVSAGQQLALLVPDIKASDSVPKNPSTSSNLTSEEKHPDIVAELYIDGNDLPLIRLGERVLLQFEGWAAVQFPAYPNIAVGTFEGRVYLIDPTSDSKGKFRILVEPAGDRSAWPDDRYLFQGVRAQGWVVANRVPLGYELWRLINGFPIVAELDTKEAAPKFGPVRK